MEKKKIALFEYFGKIESWKVAGKIKTLLAEIKSNEGATGFDMVNIEKDRITVTDGVRLLVISAEHKVEPGVYFMTSEGFLMPTKDVKYPDTKDLLPKEKDDSLVLGEPQYVLSVVFGYASKQGIFAQEYFSPFVTKINKLVPEEISWKITEKGHLYIMGSIAETESALFEYLQVPITVEDK
jgi:hypothetical protein